MRRAAVSVLLAVLLVAGCTCASDSVNRGDLNLVSLDDEWSLGRDLAAEVDAQVRPLPDPVVQGYVDRVGRALVAQTEMADRDWTFTVLDDPAVNAFALPGGHVYVHAGLVAAAGGPDELASVVAHEVAHGVARHSTERMVKAQGVSWVAGLVLGDNPGLVRQVAAGLVGRGALARFSRSDEAEADRLGLDYLAAAGYDPDGQAAMFETLVALRARRPLRFERWFQSHPLGEDRVEAAEAAAEALPSPPPRPDEDAAFEDVQRRVRPFVSSR
ncbi:M48 family metallopeptidase [Rubrivirga sp. S365]|uniref:M48 family metallopeptidase n=1 Tax=Rubrivirga sp. S365 TaxID=3076080 RepID=UPI0028C9221B|nr:M48 family metallopeptidase [Rubrivirga sp. S365]MDT7855733.1 M48 family metallopeptidase [Rubrivirga sp. S365]